MRILLVSILTIFLFQANAQEDFNLERLAQVEYPEPGNDIWGFVASDGTEYAIVGTATNTRIYDLTDLTAPEEVLAIPGTNTVWRDMKSWEDHVYVTADRAPDGLLVIDMSEAKDTISYQYLNPQIEAQDTAVLGPCHNLYIDENGFMYLAGCGISGANKAIIFDLNQDKWTPPIVGIHGGPDTSDDDSEYAHDLIVRDNIMYSSEIYKGRLVVWDVTNKDSIEFLGETPTSFDFTHNTWISDDAQFAFTTDELGNAYVDSYDMSNLSDIRRLDKFQPLETAGRGVVPHNTHYHNGYLVTSWYTDGIVITDASRPDNMVKVGSFDTWPDADGDTEGCWGAYPYLPSGVILANDRRYGFFILRPTYERACYLEGTITDEADGTLINGVGVEIVAEEMNDARSNAAGEYKTGLYNAGTYKVIFDHPEYEILETEATLVNGELTILDVELSKLKIRTVSGLVVDKQSGDPIPFGQVVFINERRELPFTTQMDGKFTIDIVEEEYFGAAGSWGYLHQVIESLTPSNDEILFELEIGYQDDFIFDQGWQVSGEAPVGIWERDIPYRTNLGGQESNIGADVTGDIGSWAYVTGNTPIADVGLDDVDNGETTLTTPEMDLTTYDSPVLEYQTYFFNDGGGSTPNDGYTINLHNGTTNLPIDIYNGSVGGWTGVVRLQLNDLIDKSLPTTISYTATDRPPGHIVEAALDAFIVRELDDLSTNTLIAVSNIDVYPNPVSDIITISSDEHQIEQVYISNLKGQLVHAQKLARPEFSLGFLESGLYILQLRDTKGNIFIQSLVKK